MNSGKKNNSFSRLMRREHKRNFILDALAFAERELMSIDYDGMSAAMSKKNYTAGHKGVSQK